ncbi:MAG TPA: PH domain-containing protein [Planctomycetota bacterium]|jgi:membrane protein YdbS with pleckstrin-like domain|nr:PH domain-containing protein [Planctomycetota bacterium]
MSCPKCNAVLPEASAFCNKCGAALQPGPAPVHPLQPPVANVALEPEQELWKGRFSAKAQGHWWVLWFLEIPALILIWFRLSEQMRQGPVAKWVFVAAAVVPVLIIFWTWMIEKMSTRYRLTTHRLFKETGILSRNLNEIELVRVDDVAVRQNVIQRIFNVGVVTVIAPHDQTEPRLELVGIENPIEVKEMIRNHVRLRRKGSLNVENI